MKPKKKEPVLFQVELLESTFANDEGDTLDIITVDKKGNIYYYDGCDRWCYLLSEEEAKIWKR
jgi:uncharacterized ParB-like nuclease family protein